MLQINKVTNEDIHYKRDPIQKLIGEVSTTSYDSQLMPAKMV
jgi:hypothetical protein